MNENFYRLWLNKSILIQITVSLPGSQEIGALAPEGQYCPATHIPPVPSLGMFCVADNVQYHPGAQGPAVALIPGVSQNSPAVQGVQAAIASEFVRVL